MENEHKWNRFGKTSAWILGIGAALGITYGMGTLIYNAGYSDTQKQIQRKGISEYLEYVSEPKEYQQREIPQKFPLVYSYNVDSKKDNLENEVLSTPDGSSRIVIDRGEVSINHNGIVFEINPENKVTVKKRFGDKYTPLCEGKN